MRTLEKKTRIKEPKNYEETAVSEALLGKILVVDDEMRIRKLVLDLLVKQGYEVIEAKDGEEA